MAHPGPLMLPPFDRLSALFSLVLKRWSRFPGPALISSVACNVVALHGSVWLSARRQPAHHRAAPKCHTPSLWRLLSFDSAYNAISSPRLLRSSPGRQAFTCGGSRLCVFQRWRRTWTSARIKCQTSSPPVGGLQIFAFWPGPSASGRIAASSCKGSQRAKFNRPPAGQGLLVLSGCSFSPQPNFSVNGTPTSLLASARPYGRPLPRALGFWLP